MILYNTMSDKRQINKTLNELADIEKFDIKDDLSILRPVARLVNAKAINANYCYIRRFKRYYFIEDIIALSDNMVELRCAIDVLHTYKTQILNLSTFIERQEFDYSPYVADDKIVTQCNRQMSIESVGALGNSNGNYIALTVAGGVPQESEE